MTIKNFLITDFSDYISLFKNINLFKKNKIIIFLKGELGSGKTTFVQKYLLHKYNFKNTSSPTFGIINTYIINDTNIYHYDLYRITKSSELYDIGFYDNLETNTAHFIEWPEIIPKKMCSPNIIINFQSLITERIISIDAINE
jgi:tRNA threonylcarbamoyladenosine biosynthesis protein TsaE